LTYCTVKVNSMLSSNDYPSLETFQQNDSLQEANRDCDPRGAQSVSPLITLGN